MKRFRFDFACFACLFVHGLKSFIFTSFRSRVVHLMYRLKCIVSHKHCEGSAFASTSNT